MVYSGPNAALRYQSILPDYVPDIDQSSPNLENNKIQGLAAGKNCC